MKLKIQDRTIGSDSPVYFIADIAANHDGDLKRAKNLMRLAKEAGADAAKFQNFVADKIVCKKEFDSMEAQLSHQASWKKSVYQVYKDASIPKQWTKELKEYADKLDITYLSSPYDSESVDMLDPYVPAYKIGSGEITWPEMLEKIALKNKPVILATGASELSEVKKAVEVVLNHNKKLILLQCNTNYTANKENLKYVNLNVLNTYHRLYPDMILGLSDHTHGYVTVLGAIALGAKVVEKHFTDDTTRDGPDHKFSMDPSSWREMVERSRELESALGDGEKRIEDNEKETAVVQRRALYAACDIGKGETITTEKIIALRPASSDALKPYEQNLVINKKARVAIGQGESISLDKLI